MGDTGPGWYVPQTLLPIYRDEILPLADVCVPNQVCVTVEIRRLRTKLEFEDRSFTFDWLDSLN